MNRVYYQLYLQSVLSLTRTLVIKSSDVADTINRELTYTGYTVNPDRPDTWKYYVNMAGIYHPSDAMMTVRSMDTLEDIEFTKENLRIHRATAREYAPGSRFYSHLCRRYPLQVPLINGVLYPVDINTAMDAEDGTILYYDRTYIEANESNLITELQEWLWVFFGRWYNRQYNLTDDLYLSAFLGILYLQIPNVIQLIRLRNTKTPEAHSFHIREYLASNGRLDEYIPYMTKEQQLYLYRNIRFINRNVGRQQTFDRLVKNLLTKRGIPLTWYKLEQNIAKLPEQVRPDVELVKHPLNFGYNQTGLDTTSVHTILQRQNPVARDNAIVMDAALTNTVNRVQSDQYSTLPTKVLESEVIDRSNSSVRSLGSVLLNHWVYLAATDRYRAYVNINNPGTGQMMSMSVKDAYIVALYSFAKARGMELTHIPRVVVYDVLRSPLPTYTELKSIVDMRYIPEGMIQAIMDRITPMGEYIATERFYHACADLHTEYLKLWELYSFQEHYLTRGMAQHMVERHFQNVKCQLVDEHITYERWLALSGYDIADLADHDLEMLFQGCVTAATGSNLVAKMTLGEIQRAMLGLMGKLSSYSVQYLRTINETDFTYLGFPAIRVGDVGQHSRSWLFVAGPAVSVQKLRNRVRTGIALGNDTIDPPVDVRVKTRTNVCIDPTVKITPLPSSMTDIKLNTANIGIRGFSFTVHNTDPDDNHLGHYQ